MKMKLMKEAFGKRCWHCNDDAHTRGQCTAFKALMEKHNAGKERSKWELPKNYKRVWETFKAEQMAKPPKVNAVTKDATDTEDEDDDYDSDDDFLQAGQSHMNFALTHTLKSRYAGRRHNPRLGVSQTT